MQLNPEDRINLKRAVREYIETLKGYALRAVEEGTLDKAQLRVEELRSFESLLERLRRDSDKSES